MKPSGPVEVAEMTATVTKDHGEQLRLYLLRRLRSPNDVADLAQEVYLRLLRLEGTKQVRKPLAFLYGVASHVLADFRLQSAPESGKVSLDTEGGKVEADQAASVDDPGVRLNLVQQVERALEELPPIQRAVLLLLKRDGLTYEEASKELGISVDMVHKHANWAKARLRARRWER